MSDKDVKSEDTPGLVGLVSSGPLKCKICGAEPGSLPKLIAHARSHKQP